MQYLTSKNIVADKWRIIDIEFRNCPDGIIDRLNNYAKYYQAGQKSESLYPADMFTTLDKPSLHKFNQEDRSFLSLVSEAAVKNDAFYFRIINIE